MPNITKQKSQSAIKKSQSAIKKGSSSVSPVDKKEPSSVSSVDKKGSSSVSPPIVKPAIKKSQYPTFSINDMLPLIGKHAIKKNYTNFKSIVRKNNNTLKINWYKLNTNPNAIDYLEENPHRIRFT